MAPISHKSKSKFLSFILYIGLLIIVSIILLGFKIHYTEKNHVDMYFLTIYGSKSLKASSFFFMEVQLIRWIWNLSEHEKRQNVTINLIVRELNFNIFWLAVINILFILMSAIFVTFFLSRDLKFESIYFLIFVVVFPLIPIFIATISNYACDRCGMNGHYGVYWRAVNVPTLVSVFIVCSSIFIIYLFDSSNISVNVLDITNSDIANHDQSELLNKIYLVFSGIIAFIVFSAHVAEKLIIDSPHSNSHQTHSGASSFPLQHNDGLENRDMLPDNGSEQRI